MLFCRENDDTCWYWQPRDDRAGLAAAPSFPGRVKGAEFIGMRDSLDENIFAIGGQDYSVQNHALRRGFVFRNGEWSEVRISTEKSTVTLLKQKYISDDLSTSACSLRALVGGYF